MAIDVDLRSWDFTPADDDWGDIFAIDLGRWRPELHPRDSHGRFRNTWRLPDAAMSQVERLLAGFNPPPLRSDRHASSYLRGQRGPRSKKQQDTLDYFLSREGNEDIQSSLRTGWDPRDPSKGPSQRVRELESMMRPLEHDLILSRVMGPDAFGLPPERLGEVEEWTGRRVNDLGFSPMNVGSAHQIGAPHIEMRVLVPKGTRAIIVGDGGDGPNSRTVILDRQQPLRIGKVEKDGRGGFYALATVGPHRGAKGERPTTALGRDLPASQRSPATEATPDEFERRGLEPEAPPGPQEQPERFGPVAPAGPAPVAKAAPAAAPAAPTPAPQGPPLEQPPPATAIREAGGRVPTGAGRVTTEEDLNAPEAPAPEPVKRGGRQVIPEEEARLQDRLKRLDAQAKAQEATQARLDRANEQLLLAKEREIARKDAEIERLEREREAAREAQTIRADEGTRAVAEPTADERDNRVVEADQKHRQAQGWPRNGEETRIARHANEIRRARGQEELPIPANAPPPPGEEAAPVKKARRVTKKAAPAAPEAPAAPPAKRVRKAPTKTTAAPEVAPVPEEAPLPPVKRARKVAPEKVAPEAAPEAPPVKKAVRGVKKAAPEAPAKVAPEAAPEVAPAKRAPRGIKKAPPRLTRESTPEEIQKYLDEILPPPTNEEIATRRREIDQRLEELLKGARAERAKKAVPEAPPAKKARAVKKAAPEAEAPVKKAAPAKKVAKKAEAPEAPVKKAAPAKKVAKKAAEAAKKAAPAKKTYPERKPKTMKELEAMSDDEIIRYADSLEGPAQNGSEVIARRMAGAARTRREEGAPPGETLDEMVERLKKPAPKAGAPRRQVGRDLTADEIRKAVGAELPPELRSRKGTERGPGKTTAEIREMLKAPPRAKRIGPERPIAEIEAEQKLPRPGVAKAASKVVRLRAENFDKATPDLPGQEGGLLRSVQRDLAEGKPVAPLKQLLQERADFHRRNAELERADLTEVDDRAARHQDRLADVYENAADVIGKRGPNPDRLVPGDKVERTNKDKSITKGTVAKRGRLTYIDWEDGESQRVLPSRPGRGIKKVGGAAPGEVAKAEKPRTLTDLRKEAASLGVPGRSTMDKDKLNQAIEARLQRRGESDADHKARLDELNARPKVTRAGTPRKVAKPAAKAEEAAPEGVQEARKRLVKQAAKKAAPPAKRAAPVRLNAQEKEDVAGLTTNQRAVYNDLRRNGSIHGAALAQAQGAPARKAAVRKVAAERPTVTRAAKKVAQPSREDRVANALLEAMPPAARKEILDSMTPEERIQVDAAVERVKGAKAVRPVVKRAAVAKKTATKLADLTPDQRRKYTDLSPSEQASYRAFLRNGRSPEDSYESAREMVNARTVRAAKAAAGEVEPRKRAPKKVAKAAREVVPAAESARKAAPKAAEKKLAKIVPSNVKEAAPQKRAPKVTGVQAPTKAAKVARPRVVRPAKRTAPDDIVVTGEWHGPTPEAMENNSKADFQPGGAKHIDLKPLTEGLDFKEGPGERRGGNAPTVEDLAIVPDHQTVLDQAQEKLNTGASPASVARDLRGTAQALRNVAAIRYGGWGDKPSPGMPEPSPEYRAEKERNWKNWFKRAEEFDKLATKLEAAKRPRVARKAAAPEAPAVAKAAPAAPVKRAAKKVAKAAPPARLLRSPRLTPEQQADIADLKAVDKVKYRSLRRDYIEHDDALARVKRERQAADLGAAQRKEAAATERMRSAEATKAQAAARKAASTKQLEAMEADNRKDLEPLLKEAGVDWKDLSDFQRAKVGVLKDRVEKKTLSKKAAAAALREDGDDRMAAIANVLERRAPRKVAAKAAVKKAAPEAPTPAKAARPTVTRAKRVAKAAPEGAPKASATPGTYRQQVNAIAETKAPRDLSPAARFQWAAAYKRRKDKGAAEEIARVAGDDAAARSTAAAAKRAAPPAPAPVKRAAKKVAKAAPAAPVKKAAPARAVKKAAPEAAPEAPLRVTQTEKQVLANVRAGIPTFPRSDVGKRMTDKGLLEYRDGKYHITPKGRTALEHAVGRPTVTRAGAAAKAAPEAPAAKVTAAKVTRKAAATAVEAVPRKTAPRKTASAAKIAEQVDLPKNFGEILRRATPEDVEAIKAEARKLGLGDIEGDTGEKVFNNALKKMIQNRLDELGMGEKPSAPAAKKVARKAAAKAAPEAPAAKKVTRAAAKAAPEAEAPPAKRAVKKVAKAAPEAPASGLAEEDTVKIRGLIGEGLIEEVLPDGRVRVLRTWRKGRDLHNDSRVYDADRISLVRKGNKDKDLGDAILEGKDLAEAERQAARQNRQARVAVKKAAPEAPAKAAPEAAPQAPAKRAVKRVAKAVPEAPTKAAAPEAPPVKKAAPERPTVTRAAGKAAKAAAPEAPPAPPVKRVIRERKATPVGEQSPVTKRLLGMNGDQDKIQRELDKDENNLDVLREVAQDLRLDDKQPKPDLKRSIAEALTGAPKKRAARKVTRPLAEPMESAVVSKEPPAPRDTGALKEGRITRSRIQPGDRLVVEVSGDGFKATRSKTRGQPIEVTSVERVKGDRRSLVKITARTADGREITSTRGASETHMLEPEGGFQPPTTKTGAPRKPRRVAVRIPAHIKAEPVPEGADAKEYRRALALGKSKGLATQWARGIAKAREGIREANKELAEATPRQRAKARLAEYERQDLEAEVVKLETKIDATERPIIRRAARKVVSALRRPFRRERAEAKVPESPDAVQAARRRERALELRRGKEEIARFLEQEPTKAATPNWGGLDSLSTEQRKDYDGLPDNAKLKYLYERGRDEKTSHNQALHLAEERAKELAPEVAKKAPAPRKVTKAAKAAPEAATPKAPVKRAKKVAAKAAPKRPIVTRAGKKVESADDVIANRGTVVRTPDHIGWDIVQHDGNKRWYILDPDGKLHKDGRISSSSTLENAQKRLNRIDKPAAPEAPAKAAPRKVAKAAKAAPEAAAPTRPRVTRAKKAVPEAAPETTRPRVTRAKKAVPEATPAAAHKVGDRVRNEDGAVGRVTSVNGDKVNVRWDNGILQRNRNASSLTLETSAPAKRARKVAAKAAAPEAAAPAKRVRAAKKAVPEAAPEAPVKRVRKAAAKKALPNTDAEKQGIRDDLAKLRQTKNPGVRRRRLQDRLQGLENADNAEAVAPADLTPAQRRIWAKTYRNMVHDRGFGHEAADQEAGIDVVKDVLAKRTPRGLKKAARELVDAAESSVVPRRLRSTPRPSAEALREATGSKRAGLEARLTTKQKKELDGLDTRQRARYWVRRMEAGEDHNAALTRAGGEKQAAKKAAPEAPAAPVKRAPRKVAAPKKVAAKAAPEAPAPTKRMTREQLMEEINRRRDAGEDLHAYDRTFTRDELERVLKGESVELRGSQRRKAAKARAAVRAEEAAKAPAKAPTRPSLTGQEAAEAARGMETQDEVRPILNQIRTRERMDDFTRRIGATPLREGDLRARRAHALESFRPVPKKAGDRVIKAELTPEPRGPKVSARSVRGGDVAVWNDDGTIRRGLVVDEGPRRRFVDWDDGNRERLGSVQRSPGVDFFRAEPQERPVVRRAAKKTAPEAPAAPVKAAPRRVAKAAPEAAAPKKAVPRGRYRAALGQGMSGPEAEEWARNSKQTIANMRTERQAARKAAPEVPAKATRPVVKRAATAAKKTAAPDVEQAARDRTASLGKARSDAFIASNLDQVIHDQGSDEAIRHWIENSDKPNAMARLQGISAGDKAALRKAFDTGGREGLRKALGTYERKHGLKRIGNTGDVVPFDPDRHRALGKVSQGLRPGEPVRILRPGHEAKAPGERTMSVVDHARVMPERATRKVAKAAPEVPAKKATRPVVKRAAKAAAEAPSKPEEPSVAQLAKEVGLPGDAGGIAPSRDLDLKQGHSRADVAKKIRRDATILENSPLDQGSSDPHINAAARKERADYVAKLRELADRVEGKEAAPKRPAVKRAVAKAAPEVPAKAAPAKKVAAKAAPEAPAKATRPVVKRAAATKAAAAPESKELKPLANGTRRKSMTNVQEGDVVRGASGYKGDLATPRRVTKVERSGNNVKITRDDGSTLTGAPNTAVWLGEAPKAEAPAAKRVVKKAAPSAPETPTKATRPTVTRAGTAAKKAAPEAPVKKTAPAKKAAPEAPAPKQDLNSPEVQRARGSLLHQGDRDLSDEAVATEMARIKRQDAADTRRLRASVRTPINENVPLRGDPEGDGGLMHGDSSSMQLAQKLARRGDRNGSANKIIEMRHSYSGREGRKDPDASQKAIDELRLMRLEEKDPAVRKLYDEAIEQMDAEHKPVPDLPDSTPPGARKLIEDLNRIPLARRTESDHGEERISAVDQLAQVYRDIDSGDVDALRNADSRIKSILRRYHESRDGAFQMWDLEGRAEERGPGGVGHEIRQWMRDRHDAGPRPSPVPGASKPEVPEGRTDVDRLAEAARDATNDRLAKAKTRMEIREKNKILHQRRAEADGAAELADALNQVIEARKGNDNPSAFRRGVRQSLLSTPDQGNEHKTQGYDDLRNVLAREKFTNPEELETRLRQELAKRGMTMTSTPGAQTRFNPDLHRSLGGDIPDNADVEVVRPGLMFTDKDGKVVILQKPVVRRVEGRESGPLAEPGPTSTLDRAVDKIFGAPPKTTPSHRSTQEPLTGETSLYTGAIFNEDTDPRGIPVRNFTSVSGGGYKIKNGTAWRRNGVTYVVEHEETGEGKRRAIEAARALEAHHQSLPAGARRYQRAYTWHLRSNPQDALTAKKLGKDKFVSVASAVGGDTNIWQPGVVRNERGEVDLTQLTSDLNHEFGHNADIKTRNGVRISATTQWHDAGFRADPSRFIEPKTWRPSAAHGGRVNQLAFRPDPGARYPYGVTTYGQSSTQEDFAEAVDLYLQGRIGYGVLKNEPGYSHIWFRDLFPERAAILDRLFPEVAQQQLAEIARGRRVERA